MGRNMATVFGNPEVISKFDEPVSWTGKNLSDLRDT